MKLGIALISFVALSSFGAIPTPPTPRTAYGQSLMLATNALDARNLIGITPTNNLAFDISQFTVTTVTNIALKTNAFATNLVILPMGTGTNEIYGTLRGNNARLTNAAFYGAPLYGSISLSNNHTLYVSPNGNNSTAKKSDLTLPYADLSNAASVATSGDIVFLLPGRYTNNVIRHSAETAGAPIKFANLNNLTVLGYGATIYWPTCASGIQLTNCSNFVMRGLTLESEKSYYVEGRPPINISNLFRTYGVFGLVETMDCQDLKLDGVTLKGSWDHGYVDVTPATGRTVNQTSNVWINGCYVSKSGAAFDTNAATHVHDGSGITVTCQASVINNVIDDSYAGGVEIFPNDAFGYQNYKSTLVSHNRILNSRERGISQGATPVILMNNIISRRTNDPVSYEVSPAGRQGLIGIYVSSSDIIVKGNVVDGYTQGLTVGPVTNLFITDNEFYNGGIGLNFPANVWRVNILNNLFRNFITTAFIFDHSIYDMMFKHNIMVYDTSLTTDGAGYAYIHGNSGILSNAIVSDNTIKDFANRNYAFSFGAGSTNVLLQNNFIGLASFVGVLNIGSPTALLPNITTIKAGGSPSDTWQPEGSIYQTTNGLYVKLTNTWYRMKND